MKSIVITKYGGPDVLEIREMPQPDITSDNVLVKVHFAGINPVDFKIRKGMAFFMTGFKFPKIPGGEIAGIVENAPVNGPFKPGDRVYAMLNFKGGGYAEYVSLKPELLCKMPENISFREAAGVPLAGLTALQSLKDLGKIRDNSKVLINGASGGVGHLAVQIARWYGADVTAVCSGKNKEWIISLGANRVVDYTVQNPIHLDQKFDIVFDAVAKLPLMKVGKLLTTQGIYITTMPMPMIFIRQFLSRFTSRKFYPIMANPSGKDLEILSGMVTEKAIFPFIEKVYTPEKVRDAHRYIETERVKGKLVIDIVNWQS
jgi:NADPH:quinone reductase-like Zn-dependent oxidoreductase